jgi:hypothetical protein
LPAITRVPAVVGVPVVAGVPDVACVPAVPEDNTVAVPAIPSVHAVAGVPAIELYNKIKVINYYTPSDYGYRTDNIFGYRAIEYRTGDSKNFRLLDTGLRP